MEEPMNHCGRPECECYREKHCLICTGFNGECTDPHCPCHQSEKPAQEVHRGTLVNEKVCDNPLCWCQPSFDVPAPPLGDWEEEFDEKFPKQRMFVRASSDHYSDLADISVLKSFIRDLLVSEIANAEMEGLHHGNINGAKAERARIEKAVGELRQETSAGQSDMDWSFDVRWNKALDAVLKIINSQGSSDMGEIKS